MKEFRAKKIRNKKNKKKKARIIIFALFFFFAYSYMVKYLRDNQMKKTILDENLNYITFDVKKNIMTNIDEVINKPVSLLNDKVKNAKTVKVEIKNSKVNNKKNKNVQDEALLGNEEPVIYIYNTHQTEDYAGYSVYDAAYLLGQKLNGSGILSYFEDQSVKTFLDNNNLKYYKSYAASRTYLESAIKKHSNLKYFLDIHRDSVSKNISTGSYKDKTYAKVLFIVGLDNPSNEKNKINANRLNNIIKSKVPNISRGVISHGGKGYNGIYNQDISENVFLIEVGGKDNTKEEVENTINIIYESLIEYVRGVI